MAVELLAARAVGAVGVPVNAGEIDNTLDPVPVDVVTPVPPCGTDKAVVNPFRDVMLELAPAVTIEAHAGVVVAPV